MRKFKFLFALLGCTPFIVNASCNPGTASFSFFHDDVVEITDVGYIDYYVVDYQYIDVPVYYDDYYIVVDGCYGCP